MESSSRPLPLKTKHPNSTKRQAPTIFSPKPKKEKRPLRKCQPLLLKKLQEITNYSPLPISTINSDNIKEMTLESALGFQFEGGWGLKEAMCCSLDREWIANHYCQIVWKLACLYRSFPKLLKQLFTPDKVQQQLEHRRYLEITLGQSSPIKSIVEQDAPPHRYFIAIISKFEDGNLFITDGWYCIRCKLDGPLLRAANSKILKIGQKIGICGASLDSPGPMPILESLNEVSLLLSSNGVRRASWDTRLGFRIATRFPIQLGNIHFDGGIIPLLEATLIRKYPFKFKDQNGVIRTYEEQLSYYDSEFANPDDEVIYTFFNFFLKN